MVYSQLSDFELMAYNACVNILAVEFLVKKYDWNTYAMYITKLYALTNDEMSVLAIDISLNMHIKNLGEMISQGDYDEQRDSLLHFLDHPESRYDFLKES